jgi:hypothetical protein
MVRYKQTSPVSSAWTYVTVNTNSYSLTGLTSGGVYRWQIYTVCDANYTNYSGFSSPTIFVTPSSSRINSGEVDLGVHLNVYPNPTRGVLNISFVVDEIDNFELTIVDAFGKMLYHEVNQDFSGEYIKKVDLSNRPKGIYMVQIKTKDSFISQRIVLQ